jgi:diguanylate cyclase (GGDEF)-like protein/PAS domain S-box-containing protein
MTMVAMKPATFSWSGLRMLRQQGRREPMTLHTPPPPIPAGAEPIPVAELLREPPDTQDAGLSLRRPERQEHGGAQDGMNRLIERYELVERAGTQGVWDWDLRTDTLYLSPRFLRLVGIAATEGGHRPEAWFRQVHPDDLDWLYACLEEQMIGPALPFHMEHRVRDGRQGWRWLACRGVLIKDDQEEPRRLVGLVIDINDRKQAELLLRQSEERYALAAAAANDGLFDWDLTAGTIYFSPRWKSVLGYQEDQISDDPGEWFSRVLPEDLIWLQATLDEQRRPGSGTGKPFRIEYRIRAAGNKIRWMACRGLAVAGNDGRAIRIVGSQADITDRKLAEQQLRQSEERYALAARGANDGLWDCRFDTRQVYFSPRCLAMLGYPAMAIENRLQDWYRLVLPEDRQGLKAALRMHIRGDSEHLEHEFRMRRSDGSVAWCLSRGMLVRDGGGRPVRIAGSVTDITARKKAELRLHFNAFHDGLTGLPNRLLLLDRIGQALTRQRAGGRHFAVLLLDIDRFKTVNDSLGAAVGDLVLTTTAARLLRIRRPGDTLARLSADEFALLIEDTTDPAVALNEAQRMSAVVTRPFHLEDRDIVLTASIGVSLSFSGYERPEELLRDASLAMYRAKSAGRARTEVFDPVLRDHALKQVRIESELRKALEDGLLCLFYQPVIELRTGRIAGMEALIRWHHPERGLVAPADFIPLAEESGLIVPIGQWAMIEASRQLVSWRQALGLESGPFVCVNVSSRQFSDDDLLAVVNKVLRDTGIPPSALKLEITESVLMMEPTRGESVMRAIKGLGVNFAIDDFGTGYSSLSYLHRLPASTLKIDKSFVCTISQGGDKTAIVQVIASLAEKLGMEVVAEGIENEAEAQFLRALGCRYGQGFHFSRPVPAAAMADLLRQKFQNGAWQAAGSDAAGSSGTD